MLFRSYALDLRGGLPGIRLPRISRPTFNFGYRHTLPREVSNLAVLGPASGFGGLAVGAGRIIELNVSVGQGLAIAAAEALMAQGPASKHRKPALSPVFCILMLDPILTKLTVTSVRLNQ